MPAAVHARVGLSYAALVGSHAGLAFLPGVLAADGLDGATIPRVLLAGSLAAAAAGPWWADQADRRGERAPFLAPLAGLAALLTLGMLWADEPLAWAALLIVWNAVRAGPGPILDAQTLGLLGTRRDVYPRLRAWGSLAYLLGVLLTGVLAAGNPGVPPLVTAGALAVGAWALAGVPEAPPTPQPKVDWRAMLRDPVLRTLALAVALHGVTMSSYDHLFTLVVQERGHAPWVASAAIVGGVVAEIGVLRSGDRLLAFATPKTWLAVAMASGLIRWPLTALAPDAGSLVALQSLHGVGFGLFWLAAVRVFDDAAPAGRSASAQSLLVVATYGVGRVTAMLAASLALDVVSLGTWFGALALFSAAAVVATLATPVRTVRTATEGALLATVDDDRLS
ncbi:MAG: hypothetical protein RLZZ383_1442 [Pseudomonadota bacterium]